MDLFQSGGYEPLASRMRPRTLEEYVGQDHILGPGRLLRRAIESDHLSSLIFSGPPGTGKTTLARVIAATTKSKFFSLNAVLSGVKEIRDLIEQAQEIRQLQGKKTILFVDEVHRWNKSQQDALLPWVENGTFILIGATTENPYFEVNAALVSRSRVFQLQSLTDENLKSIAEQAVRDPVRGYGKFTVDWERGALEHLVKIAAGDARSLLNAVELAVETSVHPFPPPVGTTISISVRTSEESIQKKVVLYDKDGDYHFDTISAFIKSIRGSDPDAALYWMARMVRAGEDPNYIFRRMLVSASEDVGLADPQALVVVEAASSAFQKVGLPEGQFHLAQAALYLSTCPKSNSTLGYFEALKALETEEISDVPSHLKDANRDSKAFSHGQGYLYPHAYKDHWVSQRYLPFGFRNAEYYTPSDQGWEGQRRELVLRRREMMHSLAVGDEFSEGWTYSEDGEKTWKKRLQIRRGGIAEQIAQVVFEKAGLARHHRVWIPIDQKAFVLLEALRRVPEGKVWTNVVEESERVALDEYLRFLPELQRPAVMTAEPGNFDPEELASLRSARMDRIVVWTSKPWSRALWNEWAQRLDPTGKIVAFLPEPISGTWLTDLLTHERVEPAYRSELRDAERSWWNRRSVESPFVPEDARQESCAFEESRDLDPDQWKQWWDSTRERSFAAYLAKEHPRLVPRSIEGLYPGNRIVWKKSWKCVTWTLGTEGSLRLENRGEVLDER